MTSVNGILQNVQAQQQYQQHAQHQHVQKKYETVAVYYVANGQVLQADVGQLYQQDSPLEGNNILNMKRLDIFPPKFMFEIGKMIRGHIKPGVQTSIVNDRNLDTDNPDERLSVNFSNLKEIRLLCDFAENLANTELEVVRKKNRAYHERKAKQQNKFNADAAAAEVKTEVNPNGKTAKKKAKQRRQENREAQRDQFDEN